MHTSLFPRVYTATSVWWLPARFALESVQHDFRQTQETWRDFGL